MSPGALAVGQVLALSGLLLGALAGALAAWRPATGFWGTFALYLGLVCVVSSTWAGSLDIVPLAMLAGAAWGLLPFAAGFLLLRRLVARARNRR